MLKLFRYFKKKDVGLVLISICFTALCVYADLTIPDYMSDITRLIETSGTEMSDILSIGGKMLAYALLSMASSIVICASTLSSDFSARLRDMLFKKVQSFSMNEIGHFSTSSLITRSTNDVTQIQMFIVLGLQMLIRAPIMAVWAVFKIVGQAWQWTLATGITIVLVLAAVIIILQFAVPKFKIMQKLTDRLNTVTRENLTGLRVVRAYNAEGYQENKFEKANADLTDANLYAQHAMAFLMPSIMSSINGLMLVIYWIGDSVIESAALGSKISLFSDMVVFSQYAIQAIMSFQDDVLHDISFTAKKGTTTAIIGATGAGKSTLINLIPRFYDTSEGTVTVDGRNVRDYDECALRNRIGYISQSAILFTGTVSSNVGFGDNGREPASEEEIKDAVETAQASEFVEKMDGTYDAYIAQLGGNLSGGQKQRLSIARAIARKPEILIFDDSFSALDYKTDSILRKELDEKCSHTTRIIVAQRIGTIRNADQILVLEDGKLAGMGTHEELMSSCSVYQQIALSQLSKEELA